jgi:hypothetical protein
MNSFSSAFVSSADEFQDDRFSSCLAPFYPTKGLEEPFSVFISLMLSFELASLETLIVYSIWCILKMWFNSKRHNLLKLSL